jgi:histidyl-tRNA synthetase
MKYKAVRGTRDIVGDLSKKFNFVELEAKNIFNKFGYEEIRTPIFESSEIFTRSLGEGTDIVSKEMYVFKDKGDRDLALRPEGTAPLVRAVVENNLVQNGVDKRFYYIGQMFRYDRPQAGRYRQFFQIGAEIFGNKNAFLDMEIISLATEIVKKIGINDFSLHINTVGCKKCRLEYLKFLEKYLDDKDELCETCKARKITNILRVFDCKIDSCKNILKDAPKILDFVCDDCKNDFENLMKYLDASKINYVVDKSLVRGLDYYTGMVFEIKTDKLGTQDAIGAGGRYDDLVEEFDGGSIPAVGFAIGEDRIVEILKLQNVEIKTEKILFFATTDKEKHVEQILNNHDLIKDLREKGFVVRYNSDGKSIKSQMKTANDLKADFVIFVEPDGEFSVKNMETGEQTKKESLNYDLFD